MVMHRFKHFEILQLLGRGGMGEVYLALDKTLERRVALKFLPRDLLRDPSAQARLLDEARSASQVQHPNIAVVHSIEEDGGIFALCMEYVRGRTVKNLIDHGPLPLHRATRIAMEVTAGLAAAHDAGIIHRDLKPANVMVNHRGQVKIMDFGLALRPRRVVNTAGPNTYGTVQYMSPEQARGESLTPSSDIFSFGSTLYEMLTGQAPFDGDNDLAILQGIISKEPVPLRELRREIPPALEQIVRGCMAKDPAARWASMHDAREELRYVEPLIETGPRDLISELSTGLAGDRKPLLTHQPDNVGSVGRRSVRTSKGSPIEPVNRGSLPVLDVELPEGVVVHDVQERGRASAPRSRAAERLTDRRSAAIRASRAPSRRSAQLIDLSGPLSVGVQDSVGRPLVRRHRPRKDPTRRRRPRWPIAAAITLALLVAAIGTWALFSQVLPSEKDESPPATELRGP
jgi:serine/threonine protein kinase